METDSTAVRCKSAVKPAVAAVLDRLDGRAPVDPDERRARLDEPSGDEARLAEAVRTIALADVGRLAPDVQHPEIGRRADEHRG